MDLDDEFGAPVALAASSKEDAPAWALGATPVAPPHPVPAPAGTVEPPLVKVPEGSFLEADEQDEQEEQEVEDLYGDLLDGGGGAGGTLLQTQLAELKDRAARQEAQISDLQAQADNLAARNRELEAQVAVLTTNISSLYDTAKLEIQRRVDEIRELREQ
eukprot:scaffold5.g664.t1